MISVASVWKAAIKVGIGKLKLPYDLETDLPRIFDENGFEVIGVGLTEAAAVKNLDPIHRDPFDRIQAVQAIRRGWTVISRDPVFESYGLRRFGEGALCALRLDPVRNVFEHRDPSFTGVRHFFLAEASPVSPPDAAPLAEKVK